MNRQRRRLSPTAVVVVSMAPTTWPCGPLLRLRVRGGRHVTVGLPSRELASQCPQAGQGGSQRRLWCRVLEVFTGVRAGLLTCVVARAVVGLAGVVDCGGRLRCWSDVSIRSVIDDLVWHARRLHPRCTFNWWTAVRLAHFLLAVAARMVLPPFASTGVLGRVLPPRLVALLLPTMGSTPTRLRRNCDITHNADAVRCTSHSDVAHGTDDTPVTLSLHDGHARSHCVAVTGSCTGPVRRRARLYTASRVWRCRRGVGKVDRRRR